MSNKKCDMSHFWSSHPACLTIKSQPACLTHFFLLFGWLTRLLLFFAGHFGHSCLFGDFCVTFLSDIFVALWVLDILLESETCRTFVQKVRHVALFVWHFSELAEVRHVSLFVRHFSRKWNMSLVFLLLFEACAPELASWCCLKRVVDFILWKSACLPFVGQRSGLWSRSWLYSLTSLALSWRGCLLHWKKIIYN